MSDTRPEPSKPCAFTEVLFDVLRRHPKRIVFTEGEDLRVLRAAEQFVALGAGTPILLGNRARVRAMALEAGINLQFINVIDPPASSDFKLFCQRLERTERYRGVQVADIGEIVSRAQYFGAMMVQYGHADALVGGNQVYPATLFRALLHTIKPLPHVPAVFGAMVLVAPHLPHFGSDGLLFLADCGLIPEPDVTQLAGIAVETGKLARHFLGRTARVAMLSHSTKGSAGTPSARRVAAACALARDTVARDPLLDMEIEGEIQADVALVPATAEVKIPGSGNRQPADVLVFPNLDAGHIALKLLQHVGGARNYGQIILGLTCPAAQVPRTASVETILGTAAVVAVEAIKYHQIYLNEAGVAVGGGQPHSH